MKCVVVAGLLAIALFAEAADDFKVAAVLDFQRSRDTHGSIFKNTAVPFYAAFVTVVVELDGEKLTARSYDDHGGGGSIFLLNHPEAMVVNSTVPARVQKNLLELKLGPSETLVKLRIQRIENIDAPR